jgi:response regulator RpfG family c-di-GMP phosphodiesterase
MFMQIIDQVVLVDNNSFRSSNIEKNMKEIGLAQRIKTTVNGGHALLYLEHISEQIQNSKVLVLLNIHTPMVNGFEFLESFKELKNIKKTNILIAVLNDNLSDDEVNKIKLLGISDFISSQISCDKLLPIINSRFETEMTGKKKSGKRRNETSISTGSNLS